MVTEAQVKTQLQTVVKMYDQQRLASAVTVYSAGDTIASTANSLSNWITLENTLLGQLVGDYANQTLAAVRSTRSKIAGTVGDAAGAITPLLQTYGQVLNVPESDAGSLITRIYNDYVANSKTVVSRSFVFGTLTNGSPLVGGGTINRLNVDENGFTIENQTADTKTFECVADATSGAQGRNEEVFQIRGQAPNRDLLAITGSGKTGSLTCLSARASTPYLRNPSFSQFSGTAAIPTDITSWTSSVAVSATSYTLSTDTYANQGVLYYRDFPGDTTSYALNCLTVAGWTLSQSLESQRAQFNPNVPYYVQVAFKKSTTGTDGSLTLNFGASQVQIADLSVSPYNVATWQILRLTLGTKNWFRNADQANFTFSIVRAGGSVGTITLDDVIVSPMTNFDGSWYAAVGSPTQFLKRDTFTQADTEAGEPYAAIQKWIWRTYGRYLPSMPKAPISAPSGSANGSGGGLSAGTYKYAFTYVDANSVESGFSPVSGNVTTVSSDSVVVGGVLVGPTGTTKRKLYRTTVNTTTYKLHPTSAFNNNSTTALTSDTTADGSLGATVSAVIQAGATLLDL